MYEIEPKRIVQLKNIITEMKNSLEGLAAELRQKKEEFS